MGNMAKTAADCFYHWLVLVLISPLCKSDLHSDRRGSLRILQDEALPSGRECTTRMERGLDFQFSGQRKLAAGDASHPDIGKPKFQKNQGNVEGKKARCSTTG
jgi:hypothetical protein